MAKARQTEEVREDLIRFAQRIAEDNPPAALRWLDDMERAFDLLANYPDLGQRVDTKRFGPARRHVVGNYLVYYQPADDGVEIVFVIHGARDQERHV